MRRILLLIVLFMIGVLFGCSSPPVDILVVGAFQFSQHDFQKHPQDIESVKGKIIQFNPEVICVQWLPPTEKADFYNFGYSERIYQLVQLTGINQDSALFIADGLSGQLHAQPDDILLRARLANALYVARDYVNACYQWSIIDEKMKWLEDQELLSQLGEVLPPRHAMLSDALREHEISQLLFPVAEQLGVTRFESVDDQSVNTEISLAYEIVQTEIEARNKKGKFLRIISSGKSVIDNWAKTEHFFDSLNSERYRALTEDIWQKVAAFDGGIASEFVELLRTREQRMIELAKKVIESNPDKRILVFIGSDQVLPFLDALQKLPGRTVTSYDKL